MQMLTLAECLPPRPPAAVALGTFDGVHLGHRALLAETLRAAREKGLLACAFTFDAPPAALFGGKRCEVLTDIRAKAALMGECGIDTVIHTAFDADIAAQSAGDFFQRLLLDRLNARHIVIGFHYHFGCRAAGDAALMERFCREAGIGAALTLPVLKSLGITVVGRSSAELCRDAGQSAAASALETCTAAAALYAAIPLVKLTVSLFSFGT